ncbi:MAG: hypothetical protein ACHQIL_01960, partial [Steroidobacterales bacterium]
AEYFHYANYSWDYPLPAPCVFQHGVVMVHPDAAKKIKSGCGFIVIVGCPAISRGFAVGHKARPALGIRNF